MNATIMMVQMSCNGVGPARSASGGCTQTDAVGATICMYSIVCYGHKGSLLLLRRECRTHSWDRKRQAEAIRSRRFCLFHIAHLVVLTT